MHVKMFSRCNAPAGNWQADDGALPCASEGRACERPCGSLCVCCALDSKACGYFTLES